jgi:hypothetical protein
MADNQKQSTDSSGVIDIAPGDVDVLRLSSKDEGEEVEYVTLFELDDKPFQVPKNPSPTVGLRYLHILRHEGEGQAAYFMLSKMLGEKGYDALMDYEKLTQDQYDFILTAAIRIATGKTERPKGNQKSRQPGPSGRRR